MAEAMDLALLLVGASFSGTELLAGIAGLVKFFTEVYNAKTEDDLKDCGRLFGDAVAKIGVHGLFLVLSMFGLKKASKKITTKTIAESKPVSGKWTWKSFKENVLKIGEADREIIKNEKPFKFSEMTENEITEIIERYRKKSPIKIPDIANVRAKSMNEGYEQISYKWNDGLYKYEARWHTRTHGAPKEQGNTWVIQRTMPGTDGKKPSTQFLLGDDEWIEGWKWYDAIKARKEGIATKEQIEILNRGHWKE